MRQTKGMILGGCMNGLQCSIPTRFYEDIHVMAAVEPPDMCGIVSWPQ